MISKTLRSFALNSVPVLVLVGLPFGTLGYSEKESKGDIEKLLELKHFVGLSAFDSKVTDKDLKALSEKKNLVLLEFTNVHGFTTGGKGLSPLKNLPALSILKLADCNLDDKTWPRLAS